MSQIIVKHVNDAEATLKKGVELRPLKSETGGLRIVFEQLMFGADVEGSSHATPKILYVLQGRIVFDMGDEEIEVGPDTLIEIPPEAVHGYRIAGDTPARLLAIFT